MVVAREFGVARDIGGRCGWSQASIADHATLRATPEHSRGGARRERSRDGGEARTR